MAPVLEAQELRDFLRDKVEQNKLIEGEETSDALIQTAIDDAIDDYNINPPASSFTNEDFPSKSLLKIGATLWVLRSAGLGMSRNHLTYQDGGMSVEISEKTMLYQSWIQHFEVKWERLMKASKTEANLRAGWGGVGSSYGSM